MMSRDVNRLIVIKSSQRIAGTSSSFTVRLPQAVHFSCCALQYAALPSTIYNVGPSNNVIWFRHSTVGGGATDLSATVTPGFYTSGTFPGAVQAAISAVISPASVGCAWNSTDYRLYVTCTVGQTIQILSGANNCGATGWTLQGPAQLIVGTNVMDLSGVGEVYLDIGFLQRTISTARRLNFASFVIPLTEVSGEINSFFVNNAYAMAAESSTLQEVTVAVRDAAGDIVDLNGGELTIVLRGV